MSWDEAGTFNGIERSYTPGYGYRDQGLIITAPCSSCGRGESTTFTLPIDLHDKLGKIARGTSVTITFVKYQGARKIFNVEVRS